MKLIIKLVSVLFAYNLIGSARAEDAVTPQDSNGTHIIIHPLEEQRNTFSPDTGSSTYTIDHTALTNLPQGEFTPINDALLQAPGVAQDSYGQLHIRGDHANLQYRINGIILPEGLTGFGETLDAHFAQKIELLTGALPAQFGERTAGIIDITTQKGNFDNGGRTSIIGGTDGTLGLNQEFYGSLEHANYYFSGSGLENDRGLEPPTPSFHAEHDDTTQDKEFGYLSYAFNPEHQLSVMVGNATNHFQIPNNPGQAPIFTLNGVPDYSSSSLSENQYEQNRYAIAALKGRVTDDIDYQVAVFTRYSSLVYSPDPIGDLIFNGIAASDERNDMTSGVQNDFSFRVNDTHTLRAGFVYSYEQANTSTDSLTFPCCDAGGSQTSTTPFSIQNDTSKAAQLAAFYMQDEWKILSNLTLNYGARFDEYDAYVSDNQLSPRIGLVYDVLPQTTLHAGYARYFTPPQTELIQPTVVAQFAGTTGATLSSGDSPVLPEKDNYYDAGILQKLGKFTTLGIDAYYKQANHLLDEGQFGQALIFAPFNYESGFVKGIEFTADYNKESLNTYANLALSRAMGKDVISGQYNFTPAELAYIQDNSVFLDHDQLITGSMGAAYTWKGVTYDMDLLYGSGLRSGDVNQDHLPFYTQVNGGISHSFDLGALGSLDSKLSAINLLDKVYEIHDGTGIGVFAPQYGPRRTVFLELSKAF